MNKELLWIKINTNSYYNVLIKLSNTGITIYDNKKIKDYVLIKTNKNDYKKIKKYLKKYNISIYSSSGVNKVLNSMKKHKVFFISLIISIILLLIFNNVIFKVNVKTNKKEIETLVNTELKKHGLGTLRFKKKHKDIEIIVKKILDDNKDKLEFLEIKYDGLIMIVDVEEKTITNKEKEYKYCNIISKKDARINDVYLEKGVLLKSINDYVKKGEIIISGNIMHNEEIKNMICASGLIYGEAWYKISVEIPFNEQYKYYTNKYRYNIRINNKNIFKNRLKKYEEELINIYKLNDFEINLVKQKEYIIKTRKLSENDAYNKGIELAINKIKMKLNDNEEILYKKVLKKSINNSTIYLELFVSTKEEIGDVVIEEE